MAHQTTAVISLVLLSGCYRSHGVEEPLDAGAVPDASMPPDSSFQPDASLQPDAAPDLEPPRDPVLQLTTGNDHACVVRRSGSVYCWGNGKDGAIGRGLDVSSPVPVRVPGVAGAIGVVADYRHTCAFSGEGDLWCWGANQYQQISDDREVRHVEVPERVSTLEPAVAVAVGTRHTCAVDPAGVVRCRGHGPEGQLPGLVPEDGLWGPVTVELPAAAGAIDAHDKATCALLETGGVSCWGGTLGFFAGTSRRHRREPMAIDVDDAVAVAVGRGDTAGLGEECAVTSRGEVRCWVRTFLGVPIGIPDPTPIAGLDDAVSLDLGYTLGCAVVADGHVRCWGRNNVGQLGNGTTDESPRPGRRVLPPTRTRVLTDAVAVEAGDRFACALTAVGRVACWGDGSQGQLGVDGMERALEPTWVVFPGP